MPIFAPVTLTSGFSAAAASYTTASVTPASNRLLLLTVHCYVAAGSVQPTAPTVTGNGLTWVQVGSTIVDAAGTDRGTMFLFRAMGASPSAGALTITPSASMKGTWILDQVDGTDTSGTNGSGAIVQFVAAADTGALATKSVTLAAFGATGNAAYGSLGKQGVEVTAWNNSWTKQVEVTGNSITYAGTGYFLGSTQLTENCTWTTATRCAILAVEIKAAVSTTPVSTTRSVSWDVKAQISTPKTAIWDVKAQISTPKTAIWDVKAQVSTPKTAIWDVKAQVSAARTVIWDVKAQVSTLRTAIWDVLVSAGTTPVSTTRPVSWDVKSQVSAPRTAIWDVKSQVSAPRTAIWDVKSQVSAPRTAIWDVKAQVSAPKTAIWDVKSQVSAVRTALWDVLSALIPHNVTITVELLPRRWSAELLPQRWSGSIQPERRWEGKLL